MDYLDPLLVAFREAVDHLIWQLQVAHVEIDNDLPRPDKLTVLVDHPLDRVVGPSHLHRGCRLHLLDAIRAHLWRRSDDSHVVPMVDDLFQDRVID